MALYTFVQVPPSEERETETRRPRGRSIPLESRLYDLCGKRFEYFSPLRVRSTPSSPRTPMCVEGRSDVHRDRTSRDRRATENSGVKKPDKAHTFRYKRTLQIVPCPCPCLSTLTTPHIPPHILRNPRITSSRLITPTLLIPIHIPDPITLVRIELYHRALEPDEIRARPVRFRARLQARQQRIVRLIEYREVGVAWRCSGWDGAECCGGNGGAEGRLGFGVLRRD